MKQVLLQLIQLPWNSKSLPSLLDLIKETASLIPKRPWKELHVSQLFCFFERCGIIGLSNGWFVNRIKCMRSWSRNWKWKTWMVSSANVFSLRVSQMSTQMLPNGSILRVFCCANCLFICDRKRNLRSKQCVFFPPSTKDFCSALSDTFIVLSLL